MKYLIMMTQSPDDPVQEWTADDVKASWAHMQQIHQEMAEAGELLAAEKLAGPEATKIVTADGASAPVVTDGVYPGGEGTPGRVLDGRRGQRAAGHRDRGPYVVGAWSRRYADPQAHRRPADHGRATAGVVKLSVEAEDLLRTLAPQVLAVLVRRHGDFADAEDAVQEALIAAATQWPVDGVPANPRGWLDRRRRPAADRSLARRPGPPSPRGPGRDPRARRAGATLQ